MYIDPIYPSYPDDIPVFPNPRGSMYGIFTYIDP